MSDYDAVTFHIRACWILAANLRVSRENRPFDEPCHRALVLESVKVRESMRRQGVFTRFLREMTQQPGYDLFVVEAVQNPVLAESLLRWGWDCDPGVMDFYLRATPKTPTGTSPPSP